MCQGEHTGWPRGAPFDKILKLITRIEVTRFIEP